MQLHSYFFCHAVLFFSCSAQITELLWYDYSVWWLKGQNQLAWTRGFDWVKASHPTRHKIGHFEYALPSQFQRLSRLGSVTARHSGSGRQPNFVALNRGCPPIFGRADITLGIGPHSSFDFVFLGLVKRLAGKSIFEMTYFMSSGMWSLNSVKSTCSSQLILPF